MKLCSICKVRNGNWTVRKGIYVYGRFCNQCFTNRMSKQLKKYIKGLKDE